MSITDALARINQIQAQITDLAQGATPASADASGGVSASPGNDGSSAAGTGTSGVSFASALAQAQGGAGVTSGAGLGATAYGSATDLPSLGLPVSLSTGALGGAGGAALPANATRLLTSDQAQFASRLAAQTGLSPQVISGWILAEESGGAAAARQSAGNNDWLNIGYTDAGTYGAADGVWSSPVSAADATAGWLKGQNTIPGYGTASSGIQSILGTVGQPPGAQVAAIQSSGWASSGYPDLPALVSEVGS